MPENTCLFKIRPRKYFYWMPIGFLHLVGLPKQFQSRSNPIFDSMVLEFTSENKYGALFWNQCANHFFLYLPNLGTVFYTYV